MYAAGVTYISFDATLQTVFMNRFFTTVGFSVSVQLHNKGGRDVLLMLILGTVMTVIQNVVGTGLVGALGADPRLGLCVGSIAMIGGPGTAASYGALMDGLGITGASVVGLASATFGLVAGSVMGGPTARRCIEKYRFECPNINVNTTNVEDEDDIVISISPKFVCAFMLLMFALEIGNFVGAQLSVLIGLTFPGYIGAMIAAAILRNIVDAIYHEFPMEEVDVVGNMSLNLFLIMALAGLQLWLLMDLALPTNSNTGCSSSCNICILLFCSL